MVSNSVQLVNLSMLVIYIVSGKAILILIMQVGCLLVTLQISLWGINANGYGVYNTNSGLTNSNVDFGASLFMEK